MTNFIRIFPLNIVVFPGENLNLHIFESRYIQLIRECLENKEPFGIPVVINDKVSESGTLVEVVEVVKEYPEGDIDIKTRGVSIFRILEIIPHVPEKLYSGAIVNYPENHTGSKISISLKVIDAIRELHRMLELEKEFGKPDNELVSYDIAHHAGLSLEEEYELLCLLREDQRMEYLKQHLNKVLPIVAVIEELKKKIKLNGYFKSLKGLGL